MPLLLVDIVIRGCCCRQTYKPDGSFRFIKYTTFSKLFKLSEKTVPENCAYAARATTKTFSVCVCLLLLLLLFVVGCLNLYFLYLFFFLLFT